MFGKRREEELRARLAEAEAELARHADEPLERRVGESVVAHLDNRQSVAGVLARVHEASLVLHGARLLVEGTGAVSLDGEECVVPRRRVTVVQVGVTIDDPRLAS